MTPRRTAAALALLTCLTWANALFNPFLYDDRATVLENPSIRDLTNLHWIAIGSRRPLVNFSYAVDWALFGERTWGWHATDVLIHLVNVLLLFTLVRRLCRGAERGPVPALAAALFAVHPLLSESVVYVSSRPGLLATTFLLSGVLAWRAAISGRAWAYLAVLGCWILATLSKETGLLLPGALALHDWTLAEDRTTARRRLLRLHLPLTLLVVVAGLVRVAGYRALEGGRARAAGPALLTQAAALWRYAALFVAPIHLSVEHSIRTATSLHDPVKWAQLLLLAPLLVLVARWRRAPLPAFGAGWFLLFLSPALVAPLTQPLAEHRAYEACAGAAIVAAFALGRSPRAGLVALVLALAALTVARNRVWHSGITLWQDAVARAGDSWLAHDELGDAYREANDCAHAIPEYHRAAELLPEGTRPWTNLGVCLGEENDLAGAEAAFARALALSPTDPRSHYNLALVARRRGQPEVAAFHLRAALRVAPRHLPARRLLIEVIEQDLHDPAAAARECKSLEQRAPGLPCRP